MSRAFLLSILLPAAIYAADLDTTLKGVEDRYNRLQSLQMNFSETSKLKGRTRTEKGSISLRRPDKIRLDYSSPPGKVWIADGKFIYSFDPQQNVYERMNEKEIDDLRTPLAFLLGNLHFKEQFRQFEQSADGWIKAFPKSDKLLFTEVSFLIAPDFSVQRVSVKGQDGSVIDYTFDSEKKNPSVAEALFKFKPPPGAEFVDSAHGQQ